MFLVMIAWTNMKTDSDEDKSDSKTEMDTDDESVHNLPVKAKVKPTKVKQVKRLKIKDRNGKGQAMKKIFKKNGITKEKVKQVSKGLESLNCIGIDEYLNLFDLMKEGEIDKILDDDVSIRVLHTLFNGLKEGWIPICGFQVVKLDLDTDDLGESMFELIDKFKDGLSKEKLHDLISSNKKSILATFDRFNKQMMNYIELYQDFINRVNTRLEDNMSFAKGRVIKHD